MQGGSIRQQQNSYLNVSWYCGTPLRPIKKVKREDNISSSKENWYHPHEHYVTHCMFSPYTTILYHHTNIRLLLPGGPGSCCWPRVGLSPRGSSSSRKGRLLNNAPRPGDEALVLTDDDIARHEGSKRETTRGPRQMSSGREWQHTWLNAAHFWSCSHARQNWAGTDKGTGKAKSNV